MYLRRRALYYVYKIIIPSCLIATLAILSFFLPTSSGERVALLITNFVSLALFILMLSTIVPPTSDTTPLIEVYLTAVFVEISAALLLRCIIDVAKRKHGRPGLFVRKFVCYYLARLMCTKPLPYGEVVSETDMTEENIELDNISLNISNDVDLFKVAHNGNSTSAITETTGVMNGVINEDILPMQTDVGRFLSIDEETVQAGSNTTDDEILSRINLQEFKAKILSVVESVSGAAKQKYFTKNRRRKYDEEIFSLDIVFFCLFALTISVTVAVVFATPPNVVI